MSKSPRYPQLISDIMSMEAALRGWLEPEARRLAALLTWRRYDPRNALWEMNVTALCLAERAKLTIDPLPVAREVLAEAWGDAQDANHDTFFAMRRAADAAVQRGEGSPGAADAAVAVAEAARPMPPPHDVRRAISQAIRGRKVMA